MRTRVARQTIPRLKKKVFFSLSKQASFAVYRVSSLLPHTVFRFSYTVYFSGTRKSRNLGNCSVLGSPYTPSTQPGTPKEGPSSFLHPRVCSSLVTSFLSPFTRSIKDRRSSASVLSPQFSARKSSGDISELRHSLHASRKPLRDYALINIPVEVALHPVIFDTLCTVLKTLQKLEKSLILATTSTGTAIALGFAIPRLLQISGGCWSVQTAAAVAVLLIPLLVAMRCTYTPSG